MAIKKSVLLPWCVNGKKSRLKSIFLILFLFAGQCLQAQVLVQVPPGNYKANDLFFIKSFEGPNHGYLGHIFTDGRIKKELRFSQNLETTLTKHFQRYTPQKGQVSLHIAIDQLNFEETIGNDQRITGKSGLQWQVFAITESGNTYLLKCRSSSKYSRSYMRDPSAFYAKLLGQNIQSAYNYIDEYLQKNNQIMEAFNTGTEIVMLPFNQKNSADTIHYHSRRVNWSDFTGPVRTQSNYGAAIFAGIAINTHYTVKNGKIKVFVQPQVFMVKSQSWVKEKAKTSYGLAHEQLHFDIAKVVMNRLLSKIKNMQASTVDDISSMIQYEYLESFRELNRLQEAYDSESNHSINEAGQRKWTLQVANWQAIADNSHVRN